MAAPKIIIETDEMRYDRIIKEKLNIYGKPTTFDSCTGYRSYSPKP